MAGFLRLSEAAMSFKFIRHRIMPQLILMIVSFASGCCVARECNANVIDAKEGARKVKAKRLPEATKMIRPIPE